ncbi:YybS family protein [Paenibacillus sp. ACRRX]|uniref:DUF2232 domain-containing protein n=1 Tax=unclassified Paenibacillus TaxID=185978 RepID=UPI001EF719BE|nr:MULTISPECIES: DUF2232 domain-containing protein [unclassified Paenibacillus]MCG7408367.1 YybS family protein [Paenibacillus sp. ACRRX]MDK8181248.1 DUF2232 domain-containing protein [Paenibacillus sp. UMB4589-SE434]
MNKRWASLAWAAAALVLLLSIGNQVQILTMSFIAVPFVILFTTLSVRAFVMHVAPLLVIAFLLFGQLGSIVVLTSFYFIIPGIVMGYMFKRKRPGWNVFSAGTLTFLVESLILLAVATLVMKFNMADFLTSQINESLQTLKDTTAISSEWTTDMTDTFVRTISSMIPLMLIMSSLYMGTITYAISRRLLTAQGVEVNKMKSIKHWMLPKSFLLYYLVTLILELVITKNSGSFINLILLNLLPLLQLAFIVQGISFLFFLSDAKGWNKTIPVILTIVMLFVPFLHVLVRYVGLFDLAFPLRKMVFKPKQ